MFFIYINYFTYKTFRLYSSTIASFLLIIVSLFWLACSYEGGNLTEEYLLPYLALVIYYVMLWIKKREESGPTPVKPWIPAVLGFILAFSFLTRLTNALSGCGIMLGIGIILIYDKQWKNLLQCILFYIVGFIILCLPFLIYFVCHDALDDMLFGTLLYNISNISVTTGKNSSWSFMFRIEHIKFLAMAVNCFGLLLLSIFLFCFKKGHRIGPVIWFFSSLLLGIWYLRSETMSHYRTIAVPFFPIFFSLLHFFDSSLFRKVYYSFIVVLILSPVVLSLRKFNSFAKYYDVSFITEPLKDEVLSMVPHEELDSLMVYGAPPAVYLTLDLRPIYHNFALPETQSLKSNKLKEDIINEYSSLQAKWILCHGDQLIISPILNKNYTEYPFSPEGQDNYHLWKLKETDIIPEV